MRSAKLFFMLMSLFIFVSCSGGQGTAQLQISSSFLTTNSSFDGGLAIYGTNTVTGDKFTVGVTSGNTANVTIPFGNYDVRIVGWDNNSPVLFNGTPKCDDVNFDFTTEGQLLSANVTSAKCVDTDIASSIYQSGSDFKTLVVSTCGGLYDRTANPTTFVTDNNTNFCNAFQIEDQKEAGSYKLIYLNQSVSQAATPGITSECLTTDTLAQKRIPTKFPITIALYKDSSCATPLKEYFFPSGVQTATTSFDSAIGNDSAYVFMKLPSSDHGFGRSKFTTEIPKFFCNDSATTLFNCHKIMDPTSGNTPYVLDVGPYQRIKLPNLATSCSTTASTFTPTVGSTIMESGSCVNHNGHTYIRIKSATGGDNEFTFGGNTYDVTFGNPATEYGGAENAKTRKLYQTLKNLLGYSLTPGTHDLSLQDDYLNDGKKHHGVFSTVREILSPYGVGGLFYDQTCTDTPLSGPVTRNMNFTRVDGNVVSIQAVLSNSPLSVPPHYVYNNSGPQALAADSSYDRRIIIRELTAIPLTYETTKIVDLDCDLATLTNGNFSDSNERRIGRLEEQESVVNGLAVHTTKKLLHWNTTRKENARFDYYKRHTYKYNAVTQTDSREYYRGEKSPHAQDTLFRITGMTYNGTRDGSSYDEVLERFEIDGEYAQPLNASAMTYSFKNLGTLKKENGSFDSIFSDTLFSNIKNESVFNYQFGLEKNGQAVLKTLSTGKFVQAYPSPAGNLTMHAYTGTTYIMQNAGVINPGLIDADMSLNGTYAVVVSHVGTDIRIDRFNGTSWLPDFAVSLSAASISTIKALKVSVIDNGHYIIAVIANNDNLYFAHTNAFATAPASFVTTNGGTDEILEVSISKTATDFYVAYGMIEQMAGDSVLAYCKFDESTPECPHTVINQVSDSSGIYREIGTHIEGASFYINYKNTLTATNVSESSGLPTPSGFTANSVPSSSFNYTGWGTYNFTTYYTTQLNWNAPWDGHAHAATPFVQPVMRPSHSFDLKFKSLNSTTVDSLYTPNGTFTATN